MKEQIEDISCENCKFYYTSKTDDGRHYFCHNDKTDKYIKEIDPNFGCKFYKEK